MAMPGPGVASARPAHPAHERNAEQLLPYSCADAPAR